jgi:hypothetical protein
VTLRYRAEDLGIDLDDLLRDLRDPEKRSLLCRLLRDVRQGPCPPTIPALATAIGRSETTVKRFLSG